MPAKRSTVKRKATKSKSKKAATQKEARAHLGRVRERLDGDYGKRDATAPAVEAVKADPHAVGAPEKVVDERVLAGLAAIQCTYMEMAAVLGVDESTLRKHHRPLIERERDAGKMSLRRAQFSSALKGNVTMMIWLGKQYLGQKDKHEVEGADGVIPMLVIRREDVDAPISTGIEAALDGSLDGSLAAAFGADL